MDTGIGEKGQRPVRRGGLVDTRKLGAAVASIASVSAVAAPTAGAAGPINYKSQSTCCSNRLYNGNNYYMTFNEAYEPRLLGRHGGLGFQCAQEVVHPGQGSAFYDGAVCASSNSVAGHHLNGANIDKALCWYKAGTYHSLIKCSLSYR
jgi:hypothetical protein